MIIFKQLQQVKEMTKSIIPFGCLDRFGCFRQISISKKINNKVVPVDQKKTQ